MAHTNKDIYNKTLRTKWPYKKHTHASINKMYELRGRVSRKIRIWTTETGYKTPALKQYSAYKRVVKRVTSGYSRRHTVK